MSTVANVKSPSDAAPKPLVNHELREKFGVKMEAPIGTRIMVRRLEHFHLRGIDAYAILLFNDNEGTFMAFNVYDGKLGVHFDPSALVHPIPQENSKKWKEWKKAGYINADPANFDVVKMIPTTEDVLSNE